MVRRRIGALITTLALFAMACTTTPVASGPVGTGTGGTPPGSASPSSEVKEGGDLIVALPGDMVEADPTLVSDSNSSYIQIQVVEGLLGPKPGSFKEIEPLLAESMPEASADGLTFTFKLRTGIKFHDGTDFNAEAVKYNYDRQKNAPKPLRDAYNYYFGAIFGWAEDSNLKSVDVVDASTVKFTLKRPQSNFLVSQAPLPEFGIQSPTALRAGDADNPDPSKSPYAKGEGGTGKSMVGTGPFMYKEWVPNDHVTIVKNPNYWDSARAAHLNSITFKPFADQTAELNALQAGDVDFAQTIAPNDIATLKSDSNFQVIDRGDSCNTGQISMNQKQPPLNNKDIRTAIAYAVNKQSYIDAFYAGLAEPANNWMPPATQFYKKLNLPTYDPAKARELITKSGLSGNQLSIQFWYPSDVARPYMPDPKGLAEAIARDLEAVGFKITFKTAGWRTGYLRDEALGKYPMWLLGWTCEYPAPDNFLQTAFFHADAGKPNQEFAYGPADLFSAFDKAAVARDETTAKSEWEKAQDILARDLPTVPLVHSKPPAAAKATVKGFAGAGNLNEYFNTVYLSQ